MDNKNLFTKDFVESLPRRFMTITLTSKKWRELCEYVLWGMLYIKEEVEEGSSPLKAILLMNRVNTCNRLRDQIMESQAKSMYMCSITLPLHEWSTIRDCIWQGTSWEREHNPKMQISESVGYVYHNFIMERESVAHQSMTFEEETAFMHDIAFYGI